MTRNLVLGAVAVVAVAAAGYLFLRSSRSTAIPQAYAFSGVCLSCQKEGEFNAPLQTYPPYLCPQCGRQSVYPWYYCHACKTRFVPDLVRPVPGEPLRLPASTNCPCPNCRSADVGSWDSLTAEPNATTAPLPKWEP